MYESRIIIKHDANELERLLGPEQKNLGRSSFSLKIINGELIIEVLAQDATAFKTVMNTLAKIFSAWEGSKRLVS